MEARFAGRHWTRAAFFAVAACAALIYACPRALAAEGFTFNPTLSLTGNCSVKNKVDQVPDPGCPGGTHPAEAFANPKSVSTDSHGDIYVFNWHPNETALMDVFSPTGRFITEVSLPRAQSAVVDSNGVIYAQVRETPLGGSTKESFARLEPTTFEPASELISYGGSFVPFFGTSEGLAGGSRIGIDPANDHLFAAVAPSQGSIETEIREWGSAAEGNPDNGIVVGTSQLAGRLSGARWLSVGPNHRLYVSGGANLSAPAEVVSFSLGTGGTYELSQTLTGPAPSTRFSSNAADSVSTAVDTTTGDVFVNDIGASSKSKAVVYEFDEEGALLATIKPPVGSFEFITGNFQISVDNGSESPNRGNLMVPSSEESPGHLLVFEPSHPVEPPAVERLDVSGITREEAQATATIQPNGSVGTYRFELTTQAAYAERGFAGSAVLGSGPLGASTAAAEVSTGLVGLQPGTGYMVRVWAGMAGCAEASCESEETTTFSTFPESGMQSNCPNAQMRSGSSAMLPDCRAYELVSPSDAGGHQLVGPGLAGATSLFATPVATDAGDNVAFTVTGGSIPGLPGLGGLYGSGYVSQRTMYGWRTTSVEPDGSAATNAAAGSLSPNHAISTESVQEGPMQLGEPQTGIPTYYLRNANGVFELLGGSLGVDPTAIVASISANDEHVFFETGAANMPARQLEPEAPPDGTPALYDRTSDGVTHVVSILPGGVMPPAGSPLGSLSFAQNGSVASFRYNGISSPLYARVDGTRTVEAAPPGAEAEGISKTGDFLFYALAGNLYRFSVRTGGTETIVESGDATVVNVAASGEAVYFVSPSVLDGGANSLGSFATPGAENLYLWRPGHGIRFVATVTARDVAGSTLSAGQRFDGLGLWSEAVVDGRAAIDPAQTTESGTTLLFESRAPITGYESKVSAKAPEGEPEMYRFDASSEELTCVSCDPTGERPSGPASLLSVESPGFFLRNPMSLYSVVPSLSKNGDRVVFQTIDALVPEDTNGVQDVYEWEKAGVGSCARPSGCLALLSTGTSSQPSYLFGASASGDDAFILTSDQLTRSDGNATASIYDAKVDGGFAEPAPAPPCEGEGCRAPLSEPPNLNSPGSSTGGGGGNVVERPKTRQKPKHKKRKKHKRSTHPKGHHKKGARSHKKESTVDRKGNR